MGVCESLIVNLAVSLTKLVIPALSFVRYMNTIQILCGSSMARMGARKDGGWDVCPNVRYLQKDNCLVYSFGYDNESFK